MFLEFKAEMSAGGATKSAERYVCIIIRIALRVGVEFILLLGEVCHVTNCDNSEHAFVNNRSTLQK